MNKKKEHNIKSDVKTVATNNVVEELRSVLFMTLYRFEDVINGNIRTTVATIEKLSEQQRRGLVEKIENTLLNRDILTYIFNFKLENKTTDVGSAGSAGSADPVNSSVSDAISNKSDSFTSFCTDLKIIVQILITVRDWIYNVPREHVERLEEKQAQKQPQKQLQIERGLENEKLRIGGEEKLRIGGDFLASSLWFFVMSKKQLETNQYTKLKVNGNNMQVTQKTKRESKFMRDIKDNLKILKTQKHRHVQFFEKGAFYHVETSRHYRAPFQIYDGYVPTFVLCLFAYFDWLLQIIYTENSLEDIYKKYCTAANRVRDRNNLPLSKDNIVWILLTIFWFYVKKEEQASERIFASVYFLQKQNQQHTQRRQQLLEAEFQNVIFELVKRFKQIDEDDEEVLKMFLKTLFRTSMS